MTPATDAALRRARWKSRRGTLELDLMFAKFWRGGGCRSEEEIRALTELLALDDEELRCAVDGFGRELSPGARRLAASLRAL